MSKEKPYLTKTTPIMCAIVLLIIIVSAIAGSRVYAWYVDSVKNKDNLLTTTSKSAILLSTDKPYISDSGDYPHTVSALLTNGNGLISIDDGDKTTRKFLELDGINSISGVSPGFKYVRPIIVTNETDSDISYSVEFVCSDINNIPLSSSMYLNYTRLGAEIDNNDLTDDSNVNIPKGLPVENIAFNAVRIGDSRMVKLPSGKSHIYMVEFGLLPTAGNASRGAGVWLDIMLFSTQSDNTVHSVYDQASFKKAINDNLGGDTIMLIRDVEINTDITSNDVFNLDLNGFTMLFEPSSSLTINYPDILASMEFGSGGGGKIVGSDVLKLNGIEKKSSLVWDTNIAELNDIAITNSIYISNTRSNDSTISSRPTPPISSNDTSSNNNSSNETSSDNSSSSNLSSSSSDSSDTSSVDESDGYKNLDDIMEKSYAREETGTLSNPYTINSAEQFKCFIYDDSASMDKWYKITVDIGYLKGIPYQQLVQKKTRIILSDGIQISNLKIKKNNTSDEELINPFKNCTLFTEDGTIAQVNFYINNINYY